MPFVPWPFLDMLAAEIGNRPNVSFVDDDEGKEVFVVRYSTNHEIKVSFVIEARLSATPTKITIDKDRLVSVLSEKGWDLEQNLYWSPPGLDAFEEPSKIGTLRSFLLSEPNTILTFEARENVLFVGMLDRPKIKNVRIWKDGTKLFAHDPIEFLRSMNRPLVC